MTKVVLLDYGCGNIGSVAQAFDYLGYAPSIVGAANDPALAGATHLVLPGVGAFEKAATGLRDRHLNESIQQHIDKGRPFMGICVGMQVLMDTGYEFGLHRGLGLFPGSVRHIKDVDPRAACPHIGWNRVEFSPRSLFTELNSDDLFFYFNHSYVCCPDDLSCISAYAPDTPSRWPVAMEKDGIFALQCHPEKSHVAGLSLLDKFLRV
ncbi:MAG: imidazole glycerol phosphate synthase subunit HisH [Micavibrio aeruginosavorus]|uniref:Imidazole glycerol phosphate synthase subunit HisH n=1 Tax=Micavibrio aeruginosavorus TaxID=349221 RepID=A0A7T5R2J4_9BACT|nr:MAG: imidazole glycerol phosphate synthase subunit HisH [Micavibrio aeruginosavorus]